MLSKDIYNSDKYQAMIVIGPLYVQQQWEIRKPIIGDQGTIGRLNSDIVSGSGAVVATVYSLHSKTSTRLITIVGRDAAAQRVREWGAKGLFDLIPTVVAARTGQRCKVTDAEGQVRYLITDNGTNLLLSDSVVQANLHKWGGSVCVSMDMGTNTLETVVANSDTFANLYILGSHTLISNYHFLSAATIVFMKVSHLNILWGKPVRSSKELSSALFDIAKLGINTVCVFVSKNQLVLYCNQNITWFGDDELSSVNEPADFIFDIYSAAIITLVESGVALATALDGLVDDSKCPEKGSSHLDDMEFLHTLILHD